jgi:hypothetical protein
MVTTRFCSLLLLLLLLLQARKDHASAAASRSPGKKLLGMLHLRKASERALMYMPASMRRIPVQVNRLGMNSKYHARVLLRIWCLGLPAADSL